MLLLHGLHPHDARTRLDQAIGRMHPQWAGARLSGRFLGVEGGSRRASASYKNGNSEPIDELRREVEDVLTEAAPDLDDILVEIEVAGAVGTAAAVLVSRARAPALHAG